MSELAGSVRQLGTHRKLVSQTEHRELKTELKLDAIIVPSSRPVQNLEQAFTLVWLRPCTYSFRWTRDRSPRDPRSRAQPHPTRTSWPCRPRPARPEPPAA